MFKKIKFYCSLPEVLENYPIVKAKEFKFEWLKQSGQQFKKNVDNRNVGESISSTAKCPGIHSIIKTGYILPSWFDFSIKTYADPNRFEYFIPQNIQNYLDERNYKKQLISWFDSSNPAIAIPSHENYLQTLIKIIMPWAVSIPKGYKLLIQPIPYPDTTDFSSTIGVLTSGEFYEIHPILRWHSLNKEVFVKAGTPLCQLIPMQDKEIEVEILHYDNNIKKKEIEWNFMTSHKFIREH